MDLNHFASWVKRRWSGRRDDMTLAIAALGLCGESGEVSEPIKKYLRGSGPVDVNALRLELGDVLHYWCVIANHYELPVEEIMMANVLKLQEREMANRQSR